MATKKDWTDWYRKENPDATDAQVQAALNKKLSKPKAKPAATPEAKTETRAERAARMREAGKATPSITQTDVTKQAKARTSTSGGGGSEVEREDYAPGREGTLKWNRELNRQRSGQSKAVASRMKGATK